MARLAHVCASLMLVCSRLDRWWRWAVMRCSASWTARSKDTWICQRRSSLGVSTLLVLCMDVAMLYAASMLRLLGMAGEPDPCDSIAG